MNVPHGWKLVPVEPTLEMIDAAFKEAVVGYGWIPVHYRAMLSAAPTPPVPVSMPEKGYRGWYCAHCKRGVDASDVTFHEQHTVCGRVITDDETPVQQDDEALEVLRRIVDEIEGLTCESEGVAGLHLNGDLAPWEELLQGGRFERLSSLDDARALLTKRGAA